MKKQIKKFQDTCKYVKACRALKNENHINNQRSLSAREPTAPREYQYQIE